MNKHLRLDPHNITSGAWWYEEPGGIVIITQHCDDRANVTTKTVKIPWVSIRAALRRKDKK